MLGHDFGPVGFDELKELAELGSITSDDEVRPSATSNWVTADTVNELGLRAVNSALPNQSEVKQSSAPIADDWFCLIQGQELGPLGFNELVEFAERGLFHANDEVKLGAIGKWRRVGTIGRLVAALPFLPQQISVPMRPEKTTSQPAAPPPISAAANAAPPPKPNPAPVAANSTAAKAQTPSPFPVQANLVGTPSTPEVVTPPVTTSVEPPKPIVSPPPHPRSHRVPHRIRIRRAAILPLHRRVLRRSPPGHLPENLNRRRREGSHRLLT